MTRQQRLRLEKGMERAEQNSDKLLQKVADSRSREKKVKTRNVSGAETDLTEWQPNNKARPLGKS